MCSTHINRQDGWGGPRRTGVRKRGNVLKVTDYKEDSVDSETEQQYLAHVQNLKLLLLLLLLLL